MQWLKLEEKIYTLLLINKKDIIYLKMIDIKAEHSRMWKRWIKYNPPFLMMIYLYKF